VVFSMALLPPLLRGIRWSTVAVCGFSFSPQYAHRTLSFNRRNFRFRIFVWPLPRFCIPSGQPLGSRELLILFLPHTDLVPKLVYHDLKALHGRAGRALLYAVVMHVRDTAEFSEVLLRVPRPDAEIPESLGEPVQACAPFKSEHVKRTVSMDLLKLSARKNWDRKKSLATTSCAGRFTETESRSL